MNGSERFMIQKLLAADLRRQTQIRLTLCVLRVLCVSVVVLFLEFVHHRDTENTEEAQRPNLFRSAALVACRSWTRRLLDAHFAARRNTELAAGHHTLAGCNPVFNYD